MKDWHQHLAETALKLLMKQVHIIWKCDRKNVTTILSLNVTETFDHVNYKKLIHNLHKRHISEYLTKWTVSFLRKRTITLLFDNWTMILQSVDTNISQKFSASLIFFLFFNTELLNDCETQSIKMFTLEFVNNMNLLMYSKSTEKNCRMLTAAHEICMWWMSTHKMTFAFQKYKLMHLFQTFWHFNMNTTLNIIDNVITPKSDIWMLKVQINSKLWWKAHQTRVDIRTANQMLTMSTLETSTWKVTFIRARQIYSAVMHLVFIYTAPVWHRQSVNDKL